MNDRPDWRDYYLGLASAVARRSDCSRSSVGAVLVRPDRTVAGVGYVGVGPGEPGCLGGACPRAYTSVEPGSSYDSGPGACISSHAEVNCLGNARECTTGYVMYVTREPCAGCLKVLRAFRLAEVWWPDGMRMVGAA